MSVIKKAMFSFVASAFLVSGCAVINKEPLPPKEYDFTDSDKINVIFPRSTDKSKEALFNKISDLSYVSKGRTNRYKNSWYIDGDKFSATRSACIWSHELNSCNVFSSEPTVTVKGDVSLINEKRVTRLIFSPKEYIDKPGRNIITGEPQFTKLNLKPSTIIKHFQTTSYSIDHVVTSEYPVESLFASLQNEDKSGMSSYKKISHNLTSQKMSIDTEYGRSYIFVKVYPYRNGSKAEIRATVNPITTSNMVDFNKPIKALKDKINKIVSS